MEKAGFVFLLLLAFSVWAYGMAKILDYGTSPERTQQGFYVMGVCFMLWGCAPAVVIGLMVF